MRRPVRGSFAPPAVRSLSLPVLWFMMGVGLLAATCASGAPSDSVSTAPVRPQTVAPPTQALPKSTPPAAPKAKAYRLHLHGGLFAPIDVNATSPTLGLRLGRRLASHVQGGLLVGWTFQRRNLEAPASGLTGLQPHRILARVDGQLVPAMAFLQLDFNETRFLVPYAGIATGYEWFMLKANDYRTDETASATFANYAWESWGGIGMRLGPDMTFDSELFYNGGSLEREVADPSGQSWREAVHVNGVGARVGLNFLF